MKLGRYNSGPSWYTRTLHRLGIFWALVIGFPLIIYVLNRVSVYILVFAGGFGVLLFVYWLIWTIWQRRR